MRVYDVWSLPIHTSPKGTEGKRSSLHQNQRNSTHPITLRVRFSMNCNSWSVHFTEFHKCMQYLNTSGRIYAETYILHKRESPVDLCRSLLHIQKKNCNTPHNYQITVQWMFVWSLKAQISQKSCALYHCKFECRLMEYLVREEDFYFIRIVRNGLMTWKRSLCVLCTISNSDWYVAGAKLFSNLKENLLSIY